MARVNFTLVDLDHETETGEKRIVLGFPHTPAYERIALQLFAEGVELPDAPVDQQTNSKEA